MTAVFGMPGGEEWIVIIGILALLFIPGAGFLSLGYLLGRAGAARITEQALEAQEAEAERDAAAKAAADPGESPTTSDDDATKGPGADDE